MNFSRLKPISGVYLTLKPYIFNAAVLFLLRLFFLNSSELCIIARGL